MKTIFLTFALFLFLPPNSLNEIRDSFKLASENKSNAFSFYELLNTIEYSDEVVFAAYKGASEAILSKYLESNIEKLKYFREGVEKIEGVVEENPSNIEVRFIRLVIQLNSPAFLNYDENIEEDKDFLLEHYSESSSSVQKMISEYASMSDSFSAEEKKQLN